MRYISLSSHFKNHPALNAPLCNFIWLVLGWINFSCWKATGNNFGLECRDLSFDMGGITRLSPPNVTQKTRLTLPGSGLSVLIACSPGKSTSAGRSHGKLVFSVCGHVSPALEQKEHLRALTKEMPSQGEERRGEGKEGEEERERPVRINAGEDKIPKLAWRGLAVIKHRRNSPSTVRMGPKDLSKGQTLGWGLRAWVIGWIKGRDPGLMSFPSRFPGEGKKSLQKSCPDLSPCSCTSPELTGLLPKPERIYLGTQDWIMLVIVWAF